MPKLLLSALIILLTAYNLSGSQGTYALQFDGTDDYVSVANPSAFFVDSVTIEAWVYWQESDNPADVDFIVGKGFEELEIHTGGATGNNGLRFIPTPGVFWDTGANVFESNRWNHIAFSYNPQWSFARCMINGVKKTLTRAGAGASDSPISQQSDNLKIGIRSGLVMPFKGMIDEFRVWSTVRTEDEIRSSMYKELNGSEANLAAYFKMSNGSGLSLTDDSGNNNSGTIIGNPAWKSSGCFAGPRQAMVLDGNDDYAAITHNNLLNVSKLTLDMWIYWNRPVLDGGNGDIDFLISKGDNLMEIHTSLNHSFRFIPTAGVYLDTDNDVFKSNEWTHIAFVYDPSTTSVRCLINGLPQKLTNKGANPLSTPINTSVSDLQLGYRSGWTQNRFNGMLDEVRIWNAALSDEALHENMTRTITGSEPGLVAYYRMDQQQGLTCYDNSANNLHGTLKNSSDLTGWAASDAFNTWTGQNGVQWSDNKNWSKGTAPAAADNVGIYQWPLSGNPSINDATTVNSMMISATGSAVLNNSFTVNRNLILEDDLDLNNQTVTLGSVGNLLEKNGLIAGNGSITTTRNLGSLTAQNIGGLGASITTSATLGNTTVTRAHTEQTVFTKKSILRYFDISPANNSGLNATLIFNYADSELNGQSEPDLKLFKSTDNGSSWTAQNSTLNTTENTITLTGINSFSRWSAANRAVYAGTYTVGNGGDFPGFNGANGLFAALNSGTVSGNITAKIISDISETSFTPLAQWVESGSGNYRLRIVPDGAVRRTISGSQAILLFANGADRITVDGTVNKLLTFDNSNSTSGSVTVFKFANSDNDSILNCNIRSANPNSSWLKGIDIGDCNAMVVAKNKVAGLNGGASAEVVGISCSGSSTAINPDISISNNMITLAPSTTGEVKGIEYAGAGTTTLKLYYNSVYIGGVQNGSNKSYAFGKDSNHLYFYVKDNIFYNARTNAAKAGTGKHYAAYIYLFGGITSQNYNLLYSANGTLGRTGSTECATLANWNSSTGLDLNSQSSTLTFENVSTGDLSFTRVATNAAVFDKGTPIAGITDDYFSKSRTSLFYSQVDIGAYELPQSSDIEDGVLPLVTSLSQNYPNPFNPATEINFSLAKAAKVNITVYNAKGEMVKSLINSNLSAGYHSVNFNASGLNSGVYIYKMTTQENSFTRKMIIVK